ncbi:hypothetical protein [Micromonospora auratinigra]|uniref:hypothetical protein n=1 Tax=Micromonospora auratinigra TaxID=261654 RepID=UPI0012FDB8CE|nr:hypothetical protein [Micromonospora auratinigra]
MVNGGTERAVSLQDVYRLTEESGAQSGALLDGSPTPSERAEAKHTIHGRQPSLAVEARCGSPGVGG